MFDVHTTVRNTDISYVFDALEHVLKATHELFSN